MVPCIFRKLEHLDRTSTWILHHNLLPWVLIGQIVDQSDLIRTQPEQLLHFCPSDDPIWPTAKIKFNFILFGKLFFSIFAQRRYNFWKNLKDLIEDEIWIFYLNRFRGVIQPKKSSSPPWEISLNFRRTRPISSIKGRFIMQNIHIADTLTINVAFWGNFWIKTV